MWLIRSLLTITCLIYTNNVYALTLSEIFERECKVGPYGDLTSCNPISSYFYKINVDELQSKYYKYLNQCISYTSKNNIVNDACVNASLVEIYSGWRYKDDKVWVSYLRKNNPKRFSNFPNLASVYVAAFGANSKIVSKKIYTAACANVMNTDFCFQNAVALKNYNDLKYNCCMGGQANACRDVKDNVYLNEVDGWKKGYERKVSALKKLIEFDTDHGGYIEKKDLERYLKSNPQKSLRDQNVKILENMQKSEKYEKLRDQIQF